MLIDAIANNIKNPPRHCKFIADAEGHLCVLQLVSAILYHSGGVSECR